VFQDSDNLVEFLISSGYLPPSIEAPLDGLVMTTTTTTTTTTTPALR